MGDALECPFCGARDGDSYFLMLHVEEAHTEDSPFVVKEGPDAPASAPPPLSARPSQPAHASPGRANHGTPAEGDDDGDAWMLCPQPDCGEQILLEGLNEHLDLHLAERLESHEAAASSSATSQRAKMRQNSPSIASEHSFSAADTSLASDLPDELRRHRHGHAHHRSRPRSDSEKTTLSRSILDIITPSGAGKKLKHREAPSARLGKSELGPYAFEDQMPRWLYKQIERGPTTTIVNRIGRDGRLIKHEVVDNETPGVLPVLAQLCHIDRGVSTAYLCHPSTVHVFKRPKEGGFCGYRNIQMLASYIQGAKAQGHDKFPPRTPGILVLQDMIEQAWDMGINEVSRVQTGGIRGTRKYIGTPEAQALLRSVRIDHGLELFSDRPGHGQAHDQLLDFAENYFKGGNTPEQQGERRKVHKTHLPPIYLQQPGHSITIVGFEQHKDGQRNLLVFDPMFHTPPAMSRILGRRDLRTHRPDVLQFYRRGERQLRRHRDYELITLTAHPPLFPAWDVLTNFGDNTYVYVFFHVPSLGYDIIPEEEFPTVFPWHHYGGLFSTDDARFACNGADTNLGENSHMHDFVDAETDTGILGVPPLFDKVYLQWLARPTEKEQATFKIATEYNQQARACLEEALKGLEQQSLPEDVYFEKSVDPAVPVHYACGSPLEPESQHFTFKRCSPSPSPPGSSTRQAVSPATPLSPPTIRASPQKVFSRQQPPPRPVLPSPPIPAIHQEYRNDLHGYGGFLSTHQMVTTPPPTAGTTTYTSVIARTNRTSPTSHSFLHHQNNYSHHYQQPRHTSPPFNQPPLVVGLPSPPPPTVDLGTVDLFAYQNHLSNRHQRIEDNRPIIPSRRPPTPVHELRDFFYERSAETGNVRPVFYGTGGRTVGPGWRARMEEA